MGQNAVAPKRSRGRPQIRPDEETIHLLIEAAAAEFHDKGYAATTMGNVAQRAGISTKTMYRLIPAKADLFQKVIADRTGRFMLKVDPRNSTATSSSTPSSISSSLSAPWHSTAKRSPCSGWSSAREIAAPSLPRPLMTSPWRRPRKP